MIVEWGACLRYAIRMKAASLDSTCSFESEKKQGITCKDIAIVERLREHCSNLYREACRTKIFNARYRHGQKGMSWLARSFELEKIQLSRGVTYHSQMRPPASQVFACSLAGNC